MTKNLFFTLGKIYEQIFLLKKWKNKKFLTAVFILFFGLFFGQFQKLDYKFETLIRESKSTSQRTDAAERLSKFAKELQLDEHLVVTAKGAKNMYSAIVYTENSASLKARGILVQSSYPKFVTDLATIEDLEKMAEMNDVISIISPEFEEANNDISRIQSGAHLLQTGALNNTSFTGEGVLVGIYDSGIDWKHPDFRDPMDPTKSRIVRIWDQTLSPIGSEVSPTGFAKGVEYTQEDINDELDGTPTNFVRQQDIGGHGTHVAGTVTGNGSGLADFRHQGFAPKAGIVIVKGGNGSFPQTNTIDAVTYFQNVATAMGKPIVVNMSIGGQTTAHDGSGPHEIAIDAFTTSGPGRVVVISAGNDYGKNLHRKVDINPGQSGNFSLTAGSNTTLSVFSFYMYSDNDNDVVAKLTTPDGIEYLSPPGATTTHSILNNKFTAVVYNWVSSVNLKRYIQVVISRNSGTTENSQGLYKIDLQNDGATPTLFHGWKASEGVATVLQNGDNEYIVGSPGNATTAVTVASYVGRLTSYRTTPPAGYTISNTTAEGISSFSAQGPRADGFQKPDIAASGQSVVSSMSGDALLAPTSTDNVDGTYYKKNQGTSMSSPGVAGAIALLLQANPNLTAAEVKIRLTGNARQDFVTSVVPNPRWGFGKLDIYQAVADELGCQTSETETIGYDEQFYISSQDLNQTSANQIFAVKFTSKKTGKLGSVNFYTGSGTPSDIPITIQVRGVDTNGNPGVVLASKTINSLLNDVQRSAWNAIDFTSFGIPVTNGEDFFVTIDASTGTMSMRRESINVDNRSSFSTDNGTSWTASTTDYRIRAMIYEDMPQIKALATQNESVTFAIANGKNYATTLCNFVAMVEKTTTSNLTGNITAKVWVNNAEPTYVGRRFEITPATDPTTATGRVTLYFNQSEFDAYNATNAIKLPTSPSDAVGKGNILIDKFSGTSSDNSGTTSSYPNGFVTISPTVENVKWNATYNYWEITVDTTGFSGFFVRTSSSNMATAVVNKDEISMYPNPVKEVLNITVKSKNGAVKIFDMSGKVVKTAAINTAGTINVSKLSKGLYIVEITTNGNNKVTKKMIKE